TLEMEEFQSCIYFPKSIEAILRKLKNFNEPFDNTTMQFILTKDLVNVWKGILHDNLKSLSNIEELVFIEMLDLKPSEQMNETPEKTIELPISTPAKIIASQILTGNRNVIEDIHIKCHSSTYDNNLTLGVEFRQIQGILWINVLIETFEILISSEEYYMETNVLLLKCIHKIILMDTIETVQRRSLTCFNDSLKKLQEQIDKFLKKLCNEDTK
ncbi:1321_t:CDS:2, partial [Cetraspora pellucida]